MSPDPEDQPTALYRLYDAADQLLYAGISSQPERRYREHELGKFWWHLVARKEVRWYPDPASAAEAEEEVLRKDQPLHDASYRSGSGWQTASRRPPNDPFWRPLADRLYREIEAGIHPSGRPLPSTGELCRAHNISISSVRSALSMLNACRMLSFRDGRPYANPSPDRLAVETIWEATQGELWTRERNELVERLGYPLTKPRAIYLELLDHFGEEKFAAVQAARALGLTDAVAYNSIKVLVNEGLVVRAGYERRVGSRGSHRSLYTAVPLRTNPVPAPN